jgi:hypothetical protein
MGRFIFHSLQVIVVFSSNRRERKIEKRKAYKILVEKPQGMTRWRPLAWNGGLYCHKYDGRNSNTFVRLWIVASKNVL